MENRRIRFAALAVLIVLAGLAVYLLTGSGSAPEQPPEGSLPPDQTVAVRPTPVEDPTPPASTPVQEPAAEPVLEASQPAVFEPFQGTIQGSVTDALSQAPLQEFQLLVKTGQFISYNPRKHRGFKTVRDSDGLFFINEISARGVTVFVRAEGYEPAFRFVAGLEADTAITDIDFPLSPVGRILGKATDKYGTPLENIEVFVGAPTAANESGYRPSKTSINGEYRINGVAAGLYTVSALSLERGVKSLRVNVLHREDSVADFVFDEVPIVEGTVRFDQDRIAGALLTIHDGSNTWNAVTDTRGQFRFPESPITACTILLERVPYFIEAVGTDITGVTGSTLTVSVPRSFERKPLDIDLSNMLSGVRLTILGLETPTTRWEASFTIQDQAGLRQSQIKRSRVGGSPVLMIPLLAGSCSIVVSGGIDPDALARANSALISANGEIIELNFAPGSMGFTTRRTILTQIGQVTDLVMDVRTGESTLTMVGWMDAMNNKWPAASESME